MIFYTRLSVLISGLIVIVSQILYETLPDSLNRDLKASQKYVQDTMNAHFKAVNAINLQTGNRTQCSTKVANIRSADTITAFKKSFKTVNGWSLERSVGGSYQGLLLFGTDYNKLDDYELRHQVANHATSPVYHVDSLLT